MPIFRRTWRRIIATTAGCAAEMNELFADAYFFIALLNPRDQHHTKVHGGFRANYRHLVTTSWVLVEVVDALCTPSTRVAVHWFLVSALKDSTLWVAREPIWLDRGLDLFGSRPDKEWSLTDCISFAVMTERGLTHALTGDRHFAQAGFVPMFAATQS